MQYVVYDLVFFASAKMVDNFVLLAILVFVNVKKVAYFVFFAICVVLVYLYVFCALFSLWLAAEEDQLVESFID